MKSPRSTFTRIAAAGMAALALSSGGIALADNNAMPGAPETVSPSARAVLERMTAALLELRTFRIEADASRDQLAPRGYKLQRNEHATLTVQRPNRLRVDVAGDLRNRSFLFESGALVMYSPDDAAYVRIAAPETIDALLSFLLDEGVEMPLIDVLYTAASGALVEGARGGILVGESTIDGVLCDQLAFRHPTVDWQVWVAKGEPALPKKIVITTRYAVGDPQFQATLRWDLSPKVDAATFNFTPPNGTTELTFSGVANGTIGNP